MWRAFTEGGSMVFEGVRTHFPEDRVAMISYHVPMPKPVALMNELSMEAGKRTRNRPAFIVDGRPAMAGALEYYQADGGYGRMKGAVKRALAVPSNYDITVDASVKDGVVRGTVEVTGAEQSGLRVEVLPGRTRRALPGHGRDRRASHGGEGRAYRRRERCPVQDEWYRHEGGLFAFA